MDKSVLQYFLPKGLLDILELVNIEEVADKTGEGEYIYIYLKEYNKLPEGYEAKDYESKGFYPEKMILDFPVRGKAVYLVIKRRRWRNKKNKKEEIHNDYTFIAEGSKITKEFSDFLNQQIDTREDTISNIAKNNRIKPDILLRHYKENSSNYSNWDQRPHAEQYMIFPENMGEYLSIDELSLSKDELYTFVTNKAGRGKKGTLVASIKGTLTKDIVSVLEKLPLEQRNNVKEITLDMANNMESSARHSFPNARLVTDRFHVIRLAIEALQGIRIAYRWKELDKENKAIERAKKSGKRYKPKTFANGDTPKQLLARSRYIITKKPNEWSAGQHQRANILFKRYPELEKAYKHVLEFRSIYETLDKRKAVKMFNDWISKTDELGIKDFNTVANTVRNNFDNILNFFITRHTNANAESFNSKIKLFRANQRGVNDHTFFLFRLSKLFA